MSVIYTSIQSIPRGNHAVPVQTSQQVMPPRSPRVGYIPAQAPHEPESHRIPLIERRSVDTQF